MSDFSDRPFVAGSIVGLRAFSVDSLGRLTSVYHATPFRPGVNEAKCKKAAYDRPSPYSMFGGGMGHPSFDPITGNITWSVTSTSASGKPPKIKEDVLDHVVGTVDCTCGYYAYFDGGNDYKSMESDRVAAIIEGFGVCTVGSRGFRAAKARLVALITPKRFHSRWERVLHNYADVPVYERKRQALAAHPLTDEVPTPETREDFWDMDVPR